MEFYSDLHIHSRFSRACSKRLTIPEIYRWSLLKGIELIGTSDFTHPKWFEEIKEHLVEDDTGLLKLKKKFQTKLDREIPVTCIEDVRFILSTEISLIYKKNDKVRKVHILILAPNLSTVEKINSKLSTIGNIKSDGRPILGYDSKDLLEIILEINNECLVIPAHIWTPWFSIFGDKSGFNSIEECFEDLSDNIYAVETGLSSDPSMNWLVGNLDDRTIISNSDAHSPENIGREGNIFDCKLTYENISDAIKTHDKRFKGTIEFYPEEGRYHYDGHRKCNINWHPSKSEKNKNICPVCSKKLTIGVLNRVYKLSTRIFGRKSTNAKPFYNVIPLRQILSEILGKGVNTKTVTNEYFKLINKFGNELFISLDISLDKLAEYSSILSKAIEKVRHNKVKITPGYDGVYGKINIFSPQEITKQRNIEQIEFI